MQHLVAAWSSFSLIHSVVNNDMQKTHFKANDIPRKKSSVLFNLPHSSRDSRKPSSSSSRLTAEAELPAETIEATPAMSHPVSEQRSLTGKLPVATSSELLTQEANEMYKDVFGPITSETYQQRKAFGSVEYAKMITGKPFKISSCAKLVAAKLRARNACASYNAQEIIAKLEEMDPDTCKDVFKAQADRRRKLLSLLLGSLSHFARPELSKAAIEAPFHITFGFNTKVGSHFYGNANLRIHDHAFVVIGNQVRVGPNVSLLTEGHDVDIILRRDGYVTAKPIIVEDDVWIGAGVTVLGGVTIGRGSTIGAGAVVTKDIPECSIAMGVPAKVVRKVGHPAVWAA